MPALPELLERSESHVELELGKLVGETDLGPHVLGRAVVGDRLYIEGRETSEQGLSLGQRRPSFAEQDLCAALGGAPLLLPLEEIDVPDLGCPQVLTRPFRGGRVLQYLVPDAVVAMGRAFVVRLTRSGELESLELEVEGADLRKEPDLAEGNDRREERVLRDLG